MKIVFCIMMMVLVVPDYQARIYHAYLDSRMEVWKKVMEEMEARYHDDAGTGKKQNITLLYDLAEAHYGYIAYAISIRKKKEAREMLEKAEGYVNTILKMNSSHARAYCLQGAFYGFRVGLEPLKAPVYGRKSAEANNRALELDPEEPQAWMEKANMEFYKPAIFGGSAERSVSLYEKAVRLFEVSPERTRQNWIYLNCLTGLAKAYEETGRIRETGAVYRKLLKLEPTFTWVRDTLYPEYLEKHSR